jgi:hypothetical protein
VWVRLREKIILYLLKSEPALTTSAFPPPILISPSTARFPCSSSSSSSPCSTVFTSFFLVFHSTFPSLVCVSLDRGPPDNNSDRGTILNPIAETCGFDWISRPTFNDQLGGSAISKVCRPGEMCFPLLVHFAWMIFDSSATKSKLLFHAYSRPQSSYCVSIQLIFIVCCSTWPHS